MNEPPRGVPDDPGATRGGGNEDIKTSQGDGEGNERMQEQTIGGKPPSQQYEESEEACPRIDTEPRPEPNRRTSTSGQSAHDQTEDVPDVQARGNTIDETKGARKAVAKEKNQDEVPPQRKLELLLSSLNDSSPARPLTTELQLAAELYVAAVQRNHLEEEEKMEGLNKILNIKEKQRLLKLARVIGRTESRVAEAWDAALDKVLLLVAQAKWHLTKALDNVTSHLEVQCTPVLHEWIKVVKGSKDAATVVATPATTEEAKFMFNPAKYSEEDQQRLRALCLQQYDPAASKAECTEDEWRVAEGVAEGDILCRTLPPVLMKKAS
ncbi:hypothetical protein PR002_g4478 [Phytophthora rubi]|uniref:Uncharacterized protein n=2 Tax=Phytophthora rubi TaxID=129364 RepID=A0A6A3NJI8_9STRA|nr:hypothetical protein PR002_g4478 [Phytophthora rubi]